MRYSIVIIVIIIVNFEFINRHGNYERNTSAFGERCVHVEGLTCRAIRGRDQFAYYQRDGRR